MERLNLHDDTALLPAFEVIANTLVVPESVTEICMKLAQRIPEGLRASNFTLTSCTFWVWFNMQFPLPNYYTEPENNEQSYE